LKKRCEIGNWLEVSRNIGAVTVYVRQLITKKDRILYVETILRRAYLRPLSSVNATVKIMFHTVHCHRYTDTGISCDRLQEHSRHVNVQK